MERLTVLNGIIQETTAHVMSSFDRWHARYKVTSVYTREGLPHTYAGGEQIGRILFDLIRVSGSRANTDAFRISGFRGYEILENVWRIPFMHRLLYPRIAFHKSRAKLWKSQVVDVSAKIVVLEKC